MPSLASIDRSGWISRVVDAIRAFAECPEMLAIQRALPISFVGLALGLGAFMLAAHGTLLQRFQASFGAAFGVMAVLLVFVLLYDLAPRRGVPRALALATGMLAFALVLPYRTAATPYALARAIGPSGLFLSFGVALLDVDLLAFARARLGPRVGYVLGSIAIVAVAAALLAFGVSLTAVLDTVLAPLGDLGDSLTALLVITLVETLLWLVGIHGPAILAPIVFPVYMTLQNQNTEALLHSDRLPHLVTVSTFLFVFPGGAGATLPLVLLLLRSKVKRVRNVAFATLLPAIANINEPLMFGLPIVLNPTLGIPFVAAPLVLAVVTWEAMRLGFVAAPAYWIPTGIPLPIAAFLATKDWRSVALAFVNIAIATAIYFPFVRIYERRVETETADA